MVLHDEVSIGLLVKEDRDTELYSIVGVVYDHGRSVDILEFHPTPLPKFYILMEILSKDDVDQLRRAVHLDDHAVAEVISSDEVESDDKCDEHHKDHKGSTRIFHFQNPYQCEKKCTSALKL